MLTRETHSGRVTAPAGERNQSSAGSLSSPTRFRKRITSLSSASISDWYRSNASVTALDDDRAVANDIRDVTRCDVR
jgi:hypothetical protein